MHGQQQLAAAPVQPVMYPTYAPPTGGQPAPQAGPQSIQQAYAQRLVGVARSLEQILPGYQMLYALVAEILHMPAGRALPGGDAIVAALKDAAFAHGAALGAIRRFLCGEMSNEVLIALSAHVNHLMQTHTQLRPLLERWVMSGTPDQRPALSGLTQTLTAVDHHLSQTAAAIQTTLGPQLWEAARARVFGLQPGTEAAGIPGVAATPSVAGIPVAGL